MDATGTIALVAPVTATISSVLVGALPAILVVFAGLTGLAIAIHYVRKYIGRKG